MSFGDKFRLDRPQIRLIRQSHSLYLNIFRRRLLSSLQFFDQIVYDVVYCQIHNFVDQIISDAVNCQIRNFVKQLLTFVSL